MNSSAEALVLTGPNTLEHRTFDLPDVTADTARLRIEACGLCGTDHEQYSGHIAAPFSFIPGHEIVGIIDEIGDNAAGSMERRAGDRVAVEVFRSCRQCEPCARGEYRRCIRNGLATMFGFVDAQIEPGCGAGMRRISTCRPIRCCSRSRLARPGAGHRVQPARCRYPLGSDDP
jgi:alcohol dehydrogenase